MDLFFPFLDYWRLYAGFTAFVLLLLALDLGVFHRHALYNRGPEEHQRIVTTPPRIADASASIEQPEPNTCPLQKVSCR